MLKTADFDFNLPEELIAQQPHQPRDEARMLVFGEGEFKDLQVKNLTDFLRAGDLVVFNDTKVIKAKITGRRGAAKIEINLHQNLSENIWRVFARPAKRLKIGDQFMVADDFYAMVIAKNEGLVDLAFNCAGAEFFKQLEKYGQMPLPPYIKRGQGDDQSEGDEADYQTIYAKNSGAVAAPTAGLHFTEKLFAALDEQGIKKAFVTLNVGAGTFLPVKSEFIQDHQMHSEYYVVDQETADLINETKNSGGRIIAVGTTSLRVLESAVDDAGNLKAGSGDTKIFIYPPYKFKMTDILMTNFHLPKSTLFMLISAFIGLEEAHKLYQHAIENKYRFYSFGDACLLISANYKKCPEKVKNNQF
jgi:S-adenosylmethionine:tRNA ribosyltransferase-isomerase